MQQNARCSPTPAKFTRLLAALRSARLPERAAAILADMRQLGLRPDIIHYNVVLDAFGKAGQTERAWDCLRQMREAGVQPDVVSFNALVDAFGKAGQTERAWDCLTLMREAGVRPDVVTFSALLDAFGKAGQTERAWDCLGLMREAGVPPNAVTFSALLAAHYVAGEFASGAARMLELDVSRPEVRNVAAELLRKAKRYHEAEALYVQTMREQPQGSDDYQRAWIGCLYVYRHTDSVAFRKMLGAVPFDSTSVHWTRLLCVRVFAQDPLLDVDRAEEALRAAAGEARNVVSAHDVHQALKILGRRRPTEGSLVKLAGAYDLNDATADAPPEIPAEPMLSPRQQIRARLMGLFDNACARKGGPHLATHG